MLDEKIPIFHGEAQQEPLVSEVIDSCNKLLTNLKFDNKLQPGRPYQIPILDLFRGQKGYSSGHPPMTITILNSFDII